MDGICYCCFQETLGENNICTVCGYDDAKNRQNFPLALPAGSILYGRYIIGKVLGQGGFGITYLVQDYQTKELVAIKEFFPDTMATRTNSTTVIPFSGERGENFSYGKISFLDEAKTMAEFNNNPNVAGVRLYFEENGTAYFVMEYVDGSSFQDFIRAHGGRISWEQTMQVILPVLDALSYIHEKGIIHRDVTPDNIYITKDGTVKLLDFGAARYSLGNVSRSLDVILKHGFAPKEQYSRHGRQGPYTDVYSVSASIYYAITGTRPDDAIDRVDEDTLPFPTTLGAKITRQQEDVLMKGLAVKPEDRYQNAADFWDALMADPKKQSKNEKKKEETEPDSQVKTVNLTPKQRIIGIACAFSVFGLVCLFALLTAGKPATQTPPTVTMAQELQQQLTEDQEKLLDEFGPLFGITEATGEANTTEATEEANTAEENVSLYSDSIKLMAESEDGLHPSFAKDNAVWGQTKYKRKDVHTISFITTLENAPDDAWDVSTGKNRTVLAWMNGDDLTVAANGKIMLPENCKSLFLGFANVTEIDFGSNVDTSNVTNMHYMFSQCEKLESLDLSSFDTSNVTMMFAMFEGSESLKELNLSGFDTSKVTDMRAMFNGCNSLEKLDLSSFTAGATLDNDVYQTYNMFDFCFNLTDVKCKDDVILGQFQHRYIG